MPKKRSVIIGKFVRRVARIHGGGSALPGLVIEKIDKNFVSDCLAQLPKGVVVISGTNGKTTTTKIVVELLESQGLKVFTNRTGSNFVRGVIAALLESIDHKGNLNADIAVLELDEAHAVRFIDVITPKYSLLLNVMRDQLDRFGEIDYTAELLSKLANKTSDTVVINREDKRLVSIQTNANINYFGLSDNLISCFPEDDDLLSAGSTSDQQTKPETAVRLDKLLGNQVTFTIKNDSYTTNMSLKGIYNFYNATAAIALVKAILPESNNSELTTSLSTIKSAFGRGESLNINGVELELFLVKNPSGFQLALNSFDPNGFSNMIAINDNYADGRDMSWLWNVDFSTFKKDGIAQVSGVRANDMALRLKYDDITVGDIDEELESATDKFLEKSDLPKRIFCSYTTMLRIRKHLSKITKVERVL
jgi:UDP-N-acetylmuramyl tripeptide synthase